MEGLELIVVVGATILVGGWIAGRLRVPSPLVLLVLGAGIGFIPALSGVALPPDLVLLLFLPAILYWESLNTSLREIRRNLRVILLQSIALVLATAAIVAVIGHALGLSWPVALALGAILAPTDATAVAAVAGRMPRRTITILRAESLINDGTALVIYAIAVSAAVGGTVIDLGDAAFRFVLSYVLGIAIGVAVGLLAVAIRKILTERLLANTLSVLTPFLAYLPAELLGVSGVVAVVTAGLLLSQVGPRFITASMRTQSFGFWQVTTFLLNATLFVLIGLELHNVTDGLGVGWAKTVGIGLLIALVVVVTRLAWSNTVPYIIRAIDRRPAQRARRVGLRQRLPSAWAGFRGAVSLAAALALPLQTDAGELLEGRDLVVTVTFIVILVTLLVQGLTLPAIVRWARLPPDPTEFDEELLAEQTGLEAALEALPDVAARLRAEPAAVEFLRQAYEKRLAAIHRDERDPSASLRDETALDRKAAVQSALVPVRRAAILQLRDDGRIDDVVLRRVQAQLDLEELRLSGPEEDE